jgi:hypothetical protein
VQAVDPVNETILFSLGMALSDKKQLDESIEGRTKFVELNPQSAKGFISLGVAPLSWGNSILH